MIDKIRQVITGKGETKDIEYQHSDAKTIYDTGNLTWEWKNTINTKTSPLQGTALNLGYYNPEQEKIMVSLGSIMMLSDTEDQALMHLNETVLHELTHWADHHQKALLGNRQRHTDSEHAERYRKILKPLTGFEDTEPGDFGMEGFRFLQRRQEF